LQSENAGSRDGSKLLPVRFPYLLIDNSRPLLIYLKYQSSDSTAVAQFGARQDGSRAD